MALNLKENSDESLIKMVTIGNHDAFAELVQRHVTRYYHVSFKFVRSKESAEDIVQECFLKLWQSPQKFCAEKNIKFVTWFSRVVVNASLDAIKKHKDRSLPENFDPEDESKTSLQIIEENLEFLGLEQALEKLNKKQRQALSLSFLENRKNQESAQIMGLSLKAFQSLLMRSKEALKLILKKDPQFYEK